MWMLLCKPIVIPTNIPDQTMVTAEKCRAVNVAQTDQENKYVFEIIQNIPEIMIKNKS
jgi:hypothetical protein